MRLGLLLTALIFAADQLTKKLMWDVLFSPPQQLSLTSFLNMTPVLNKGVSFGLFPAESTGGMAFIILLTLLIVLVLLFWLRSTPEPEGQFAFGLIIGGALGNLYDRITIGAVVDFFDFHYAGWHWPAFNIADTAIFLGVILLLIDHFTKPSEQVKT
jgi:signal peptidase II